MRSSLAAWLCAACAVAGFGCTDETKTQVLTGKVTTQGATAVRAVDGTEVITAARVRSDGSFTLQLPVGHRYRLEVLTSSGVRNVVMTSNGSLVDLTFGVCAPAQPFDLGGFGTPPGCGGTICDPSDPNCGGTMCDPSDPNCKPPPPPCDPMDPNCMPCDPNDPTCGKCDPNDPMCVPPPPCDPTDPMCVPPCDPTDPTCQPCDPNDPTCKQCLPGDPNCGICDPMVDANCPTPPPPCTDPMDPNTCKDPCMEDPALCGCDPSTTMTCWPPPAPYPGSCDGLSPEHLPGDFGCKGSTD